MDKEDRDLVSFMKLFQEINSINNDYHQNLDEANSLGLIVNQEMNIESVIDEYKSYFNQMILDASTSGNYSKVKSLSELMIGINETQKQKTRTDEPQKYILTIDEGSRTVKIRDNDDMKIILSNAFPKKYFDYTLQAEKKMMDDLKLNAEEPGYIVPEDFQDIVRKRDQGVYDNLENGFKLALTKIVSGINQRADKYSNGKIDKLFERGPHGNTAYRLITRSIEIR